MTNHQHALFFLVCDVRRHCLFPAREMASVKTFFLFEEARSTLIPFLSFMIPENKNPLVFVLLETTSSVFVGSDQRYFFQAAINVRSAL